MNLLKSFKGLQATLPSRVLGLMPYGGNKAGGSHDHRYNTGEDRTPAQKQGDAKRTKAAN